MSIRVLMVLKYRKLKTPPIFPIECLFLISLPPSETRFNIWANFCIVKVGGVVLVAIGSWARLERTRFGSFDNLAVDPAIFLIIVGCVMFFISIFGCFGSIRENICLLKCVSTKYFIQSVPR